MFWLRKLRVEVKKTTNHWHGKGRGEGRNRGGVSFLFGARDTLNFYMFFNFAIIISVFFVKKKDKTCTCIKCSKPQS